MTKLNRTYILLGFLTVIYIALTVWLPTNADTLARYNLSAGQARNLRLAIVLPYVIIWFFAFLGFVKLKSYSRIINKSRNGKALSIIANGLFVLAIGLPINAIFGRLISYVEDVYPHFMATSNIVGNYLDIAIGLIGMGLIYKGAQRLTSTVDSNVKTEPSYLVMIALALIGTSYAYLTFTNPNRQFPPEVGGHAAYYLPDYLLLFTVVLPFIVTWYKGLHGAYYISVYRKRVVGIVYKKALGYLATGIIFVVLSRIMMRYLTSLNTIAESWALHYILTVVYCLLIVIAVGFGLIALGSNKLKKIEEA